MRIRASLETIKDALVTVNALYENNIKFGDHGYFRKNGNFYSLTLRNINSRAMGARKSASGRYACGVSWEAHRDFMKAIFDKEPNAIIHSSLATYKGVDDFNASFPSTAFHNQGSKRNPVYMTSLSV